jgi:ribonuclease HI
MKPTSEAQNSPSTPWPRPNPGWAALSVDGSFDDEGRAGTGMVLRDSNGTVIFSACRVLFNCNDALETEFSALMEGLALAQEQSELPIIIQSDYASVLTALEENIRNRSIYCHLVDEVIRLMNLREVILMKIGRD